MTESDAGRRGEKGPRRPRSALLRSRLAVPRVPRVWAHRRDVK